MKQIAGTLKLELAQYREVMEFAKFGANLDAATKQQLLRGARLVESLKQGQFQPIEVAVQVAYIYLGISGYLDNREITHVKKLQAALGSYFKLGGKRTSVDVLEKSGEVTAAWKSYVFADLLDVESKMGTLKVRPFAPAPAPAPPLPPALYSPPHTHTHTHAPLRARSQVIE